MRYFAFIIAAAAALPAAAQSTAPAEVHVQNLMNSTMVVHLGDGETVDSLDYIKHLTQFYEDQFRHIQDPRAPYFMLMSRKGNIGMGIGGKLEMLGFYDWDGSIAGSDFTPYTIPMTVDPTARNVMQTTPGQSTLFFTVFGSNARIGMYRVYVAAKFNGPGRALKLNKAYATVGDWTVGYANSTFDDPTAQPATVETEGPNSQVGNTRLLVRYMHQLKDNFTYALSLETPKTNIAATSTCKQLSDYAPDVAAFLQYQKGHEHVRLAAIMSPMGYRDLATGANHRVLGWGLNLSTLYRPVDPLTVYAAFNTGQGIGDMVNDLSCGSNDLIGMKNDPGKMYAPWSYGWYAALQYNYSHNLFSTVIFSQERMLPKSGADYGGPDYRYGLYGTANVFWNITTRMQVGAEVNIGKRCDMDGSSRMAYRAGVMAEFSF